MAGIVLEQVSRVFPDGTVGVRDLDLDIVDGEFVVLVGPSGSGKSTALRMVAGLEEVSSGTIRIGDRVVNDLPARDRDIAMVFQNYALYPHMSVFDNMAFALKLRKVRRDEIRRRVEEAADLLSIRDLLGRKPRQLSGGQRQRVAMGRAIVREPAVFLMDEPLSNLDAKLRVQMRSEIARLHQRLGTTTVYVTHDQVEAVTMADRVAVLRDGILQQVDTPQSLYEQPVNLFVAGFIGSPAMNLVRARIAQEDGGASVVLAGQTLLLPGSAPSGLSAYRDREIVLGIRPEDFEDPEFSPRGEGGQLLEVSVALTEPLGAEIIAHIDIGAPSGESGPPLERVDKQERRGDVGASGGAAGGGHRAAATARLNPRTGAAPGRTMQLVVDTGRLYFFDPETGEAIQR